MGAYDYANQHGAYYTALRTCKNHINKTKTPAVARESQLYTSVGKRANDSRIM